MIKRIALVGASSTGKTTVFELLKGKLSKYEFINESTRSVAKYGFPINEFGTDATQLAISSFHLEALLKPGNILFDRGYLDLLVYTNHMDVDDSTKNFIEDTWHRVKGEYTHYIYFPIEFASVDDGVRSVNEEWRKEIDQEFKKELDNIYKPYLTVTGSPLQRVEQILDFIK
jgi:hypothetical protein